MRTWIPYLTLTLLLAVVLALFAFQLDADSETYGLLALSGLHPQQDTRLLLKDFTASHVAGPTINLTQLYASQPMLLLASENETGFKTKPTFLAKLNCQNQQESDDEESTSCSEAHFPLMMMQEKTFQLQAAAKTGQPVPDNFISDEPDMDEAGRSYALALVLNGPSQYRERDWVENHLKYFRVSELDYVLNRFRIEHPVFSVLATLTETQLQNLMSGKEMVFSKKYVLIRDSFPQAFSHLTYQVYPSEELHRFLSQTPYAITAGERDLKCVWQENDNCWVLNPSRMASVIQKYSRAALAVLSLLAAAIGLLIFRTFSEKRRAENQHQLALQILSHEFRTPVSSLMLLAEQLNRNQPAWADSQQDVFTRLTAEIYRLQRTVEFSKTYLRSRNKKIEMQTRTFTSAHEWFDDFLQSQFPEVTLQMALIDQPVAFDPSWLQFVLANLLRNAQAHGCTPIKLTVAWNNRLLQISVQDQGKCEFNRLEQMTEAFTKSQRSSGFGLGLNLVSTIITSWGGELQFRASPTTFAFTIPQVSPLNFSQPMPLGATN